jgi:hypothetical protein
LAEELPVGEIFFRKSQLFPPPAKALLTMLLSAYQKMAEKISKKLSRPNG